MMSLIPSIAVLGLAAFAALQLALRRPSPTLFGLEPMPLSFFVVFNLTWIAIWIAAVPLLRSSRKPAFFAAWFLAIAGMLNGVAHPLMAVASGGYFPGLISSPFIGLASIYLWQQLDGATSSHAR